ncbi:MAG: sn-glycerol-1-phosphate dehydrogenase [Lachnospiraceae bacterium]|nr:sn-glycerol-1-phosphate dehydrogenase [Lachnospiraceae bacterium]
MPIDLNSYIDRDIFCSCGRTHFSGVKLIDIDQGAQTRLPGHIRDLGYHKVFLVADINTWKAAGEAVSDALAKASIPCESVILNDEEVIPDEKAIGEIMTAYPIGYDLVLGVGSGTLNDLCKFVSHRLGIDYIIFATAPSMDGFVSIGSALMLRHVKTTLDCQGPVAVIGDTDVLSVAPMHLIAAGLGDTLGKYTCLLDWKLSHLINGEYYCPEVVGMVETALKTVSEQSAKVESRDPAAIKAVTEALVLTGIAMSFVGNSRPASGCEHHFAHYWEMKMLMDGKTPANHGTQVGVGMILALKLYHKLAKEQPDFEAAMERSFDREGWERRMRECYGIAADGIIALENKAGKNDVAKRNRRLLSMKQHWPEIQRTIEEYLPATGDMIDLLTSLHAPVEVTQMGVPAPWAREAVVVAKEVRERYTLLQILWDLGLAEKYAEEI